MTDHEPPPDVSARRRASHLREALGLTSVPPHVGTELLSVAAVVSAQAKLRLAKRTRVTAALPQRDRQWLHEMLDRTVVEFARIVEGRPTVETVSVAVIDHVIDSTDPTRLLMATQRTLDMLRTSLRELWPTLTVARGHTACLDLAFDRYADTLSVRALDNVLPPGPGNRHLSEQTRLRAFFTLIERRGLDHPVPLYIALGPRTAGATPPCHPAAPGGVGVKPHYLIASDHVLLVTPDRPVRSGGVLRPSGPVARSGPTFTMWGGPVPPESVAAAYQTQLTMLRLVEAGLSAPPEDLLTLPDLGFVQVRPQPAAISQIETLLRPLASEDRHLRLTLARTLHLRLATCGNAESLGLRLSMHPQTIRNHLKALRRLFGDDLDFGRHTHELLVALALVIPLWEQEAS